MGFISIMKGQENPDGIEGHIEREQFQEWSKQFPRKKKFTGGMRTFESTPFISKSMQQVLDNEQMRKDCAYWKTGCRITQCADICKRRVKEERKAVLKLKEDGLIKLRAVRKQDRDTDLKRKDYWRSEIAFDCPITGLRHTVLDCLNSCDKWGRRFQSTGYDGGTETVLHCCSDTQGEREVRTGIPTKP